MSNLYPGADRICIHDPKFTMHFTYKNIILYHINYIVLCYVMLLHYSILYRIISYGIVLYYIKCYDMI